METPDEYGPSLIEIVEDFEAIRNAYQMYLNATFYGEVNREYAREKSDTLLRKANEFRDKLRDYAIIHTR